ncbi:MAG: hypothetical protein SVW51_18055 [Pseudomonadota bacterium]|nr:hypothetical protein [Pseudomonadota bacterium]
MTSSNRFVTHLVENQPTIPAPYNLWRDDALLRVFVNQHLPPFHQHDEGLLDNYGQLTLFSGRLRSSFSTGPLSKGSFFWQKLMWHGHIEKSVS